MNKESIMTWSNVEGFSKNTCLRKTVKITSIDIKTSKLKVSYYSYFTFVYKISFAEKYAKIE